MHPMAQEKRPLILLWGVRPLNIRPGVKPHRLRGDGEKPSDLDGEPNRKGDSNLPIRSSSVRSRLCRSGVRPVGKTMADAEDEDDDAKWPKVPTAPAQCARL
jgi:hypothetical protein